jgi:hypothetical protein
MDSFGVETLSGFHPETALLPNFGVNSRPCLCGANSYAFAQELDFLDLGEIDRFSDENGTVPI